MNGAETLRTAWEAIRSRRMRSALTVLGILIGIAAVMLTVGLGQGAQQKVASQIDALGTNLLVVSPGSTTSSTGVRGGFGSASTLTTADAALLAQHDVAPDVAAVAPVTTSQSDLTAGANNWTTSVVATTPAWEAVRARSVTSGRFFTTAELDSAAKVAVIGSTTAQELFGLQNPVGQTVSVDGTPLTVIGELNTAGSTVGGDQDDQLVVPSTTWANASGSAATTVSTIYVEAASSHDLSAAYQETSNALLTSHGVTSASADFTVASQASLVQTATSTTQILTALLAGIAAISLLVGGIGVMNIMLVSVTERIREIGVRKALGATPSVIRRQFLVEAALLGLAGGILGILVGIAGALILSALIGFGVAVSIPATIISLVISLAIGIIAGVYPAHRAAQLAPIDALRTE